MRMSKNMLHQTIPALRLRIREPVKKSVSFRVLDPVGKVPLFFMAERFAIGNEKLKVPCVRLIYMRIIDLIDDTMAKREQDAAARMIGGAESFLRTRSPAWRSSRRAKCHLISSVFAEIGKIALVSAHK